MQNKIIRTAVSILLIASTLTITSCQSNDQSSITEDSSYEIFKDKGITQQKPRFEQLVFKEGLIDNISGHIESVSESVDNSSTLALTTTGDLCVLDMETAEYFTIATNTSIKQLGLCYCNSKKFNTIIAIDAVTNTAYIYDREEGGKTAKLKKKVQLSDKYSLYIKSSTGYTAEVILFTTNKSNQLIGYNCATGQEENIPAAYNELTVKALDNRFCLAEDNTLYRIDFGTDTLEHQHVSENVDKLYHCIAQTSDYALYRTNDKKLHINNVDVKVSSTSKESISDQINNIFTIQTSPTSFQLYLNDGKKYYNYTMNTNKENSKIKEDKELNKSYDKIQGITKSNDGVVFLMNTAVSKKNLFQYNPLP